MTRSGRSPARPGPTTKTATPRHRLRVQSPALASAARRRSVGPSVSAGGPTTPPHRWGLAGECAANGEEEEEKGKGKMMGSVRKMAAAMWWLQPLQESGDRRGGGGRRLGFERNPGHLHAQNRCHQYKSGIHGSTRNGLVSCSSPLHPMDNVLLEDEASSASPHIRMEMGMKWDHRLPKNSDESSQVFHQHKLLNYNSRPSGTEVYNLQGELLQAQNHISELEAERRSAKKKLDNLLRNVAEEKASWRSREHEKVRNIMDAVKEDLNRERKNRQRAEVLNSKLVNELTEVKLSAKRYLQDYEKERKARELMEEVCDELAKEIAEDKAEVEALKSESMKMREEVDEERKMLQMAEVWREERVQMKLLDAKLALENKYSQLNKLQAHVEAFLNVQLGNNLDREKIREAEKLGEAITSMKVQDVKEFSYQPPPASEDIFAVFEELEHREDTNAREIEECNEYSPVGRASKIHTASPDTDIFLEKPVKRSSNKTYSRNEDAEDDIGWETVSHVEDQGSSNSLEGSEPSVNGYHERSDASVSATDWDGNYENGKSQSEISEVCLATAGKYRKKRSFIRLWRSSNADDHKKIAAELFNGRISNGRKSNAIPSPDLKAGEVCASSPSVGQWSPSVLNPHVTRGIEGCIEWPRGVQKHNLKSKLMEPRIDSNKVQLRQALKQKM